MVIALTGEELVNIYAFENQDQPVIAPLLGGGYVVIWESEEQNGSGDGLTGQIYNEFGERVGSEFFVETLAVGTQQQISVTGTSDGGFVVAWRDATGQDAYFQIFDSSGTAVGTQTALNDGATTNVSVPNVTALSGGGFVATWSDNTGDVIGRVYDAAGAPVGAEFIVNSTTTSTQRESDTASLGTGFVTVWEDLSGADGNSWGVFGQRFDAAGGKLGGEFLVNTTTTGIQFEAAVAELAGGGFVVAFTGDGLDSSSYGIGARIFDAAGNPVTNDILVNVNEAGSQDQPDIVGTASGGFVVAWRSGTDIYAREFDASGNPVSDEVQVNEATTGTQSEPELALLSNGLVVVTYQTSDPDQDGSGNAVLQRVLQPNGVVAPVLPVRPELEGFQSVVNTTETAINAGPVLLDANGAAAVSDSDSADFDGGVLNVGRLNNSEGTFGNALTGVTSVGTDLFGLISEGDGVNEVRVTGSDVFYEGVLIGQITAGGTPGEGLQVTFNANADRDAVERVVERLSYSNSSDAPDATVEIAILLSDGDGGTSDPVRVSLNIAPEIDATGPVGEAQQVNSFSASTQDQAEVAALAGGGWVTVWRSFGQDTIGANGYGVVGQIFDAEGVRVGAEFFVAENPNGNEQRPTVQGINGGPNDGGFIVVYYDNSESAQGYLRAQVFDATGTKVGSEFSIVAGGGNNIRPNIDVAADGTFVVAYSRSNDVFAQRFDADGNAVGSEISVNTTLASTQELPEIKYLSNGTFAVTWDSYNQDSGVNDDGVITRIFGADGTPLTGEILVNTAQAGNQSEQAIAGLVGGGFVIAWTDFSSLDGSFWGVYAQRFDNSGAPVGDQFLVADDPNGYQYQPAVIGTADGGFMVSWTEQSGSDGYEIFGQFFDASGGRVDGSFEISGGQSGTQVEPRLARTDTGDIVVIWEDTGGADGSGSGIFQRLVAPVGSGLQNTAPRILGFPDEITLDEAGFNAGTVALLPGVAVTDTDSADFDGGRLLVSRQLVLTPTDQFLSPDNDSQHNFGIANQGNGAGLIGVSGTTISFGGVAFASIVEDGQNGALLDISLGANATKAAVEALLQALTYTNPSNDPVDQLELLITLSDGDGGGATPYTVTLFLEQEPETPGALTGEIKTNTYELNIQDSQRVGELSDGGYVIVWSSNGQDTSGRGVYGQRYNANGEPVGTEFQINTNTASGQIAPDVAGLAGGGFMVVWNDQSSAADIKLRVYDAAGNPTTAEIDVSSVSGTESEPSIAVLNDGDAIIAYQQSESGVTSGFDITIQRVDSAGVLVGGPTIINQVAGNTQSDPEVVALSGGGYAVVWTDNGGSDGSSQGIRARVYNASDTPITNDFLVNTTTQLAQNEPDIAALTDGGFVITWTDNNGADGASAGVFAQRYNASGDPVGGEFQVNDYFTFSQYQPNVTGLDTGGFAIAYRGASAFGNDEIVIQFYAADGSRIDEAQLVNARTALTQADPDLALLNSGAVVVTYQSAAQNGENPDGDNFGVYHRILGEAGDIAPPQTAPDLQFFDTSRSILLADLGTPTVLDTGVLVVDPDSADFDGGEIHYSYMTGSDANDALTILDGNGVTLNGSAVEYLGVQIGTIDATDDGTSGADFRILLNANATAESAARVIERVAYSTTALTPTATDDRVVSLIVSDGDGGRTDPESIFIDAVSSANPADIQLSAFEGTRAVTEQEAEAGLLVDANVDFRDNESTGFAGGRIEVTYNTGTVFRTGSAYETLTIRNEGTGTDQVGVSGTTITYEGVAVAEIDGTLDGQSGNDLQLNLLAAANEAAIDSILEAVEYTNTSDGPRDTTILEFRVFDGGAVNTGAQTKTLVIAQEDDGSLTPLGKDVLVNSYVEGQQERPAVAALDDGGYVVVWSGYNQDVPGGFSWGSYGQRFDANGERVGSEFQINTTEVGNQDYVTVASAGTGWIAVWEETDGNATGIRARIYDVNGVGGLDFEVNVETTSTQARPEVVELSNGNLLVAWYSASSGSAGDGNGNAVIGRIFDSTGAAVTGELILNQTTNGAQDFPDITPNGTGGFAVAWMGPDGSSDGVYTRVFDDTGTATTNEILVNTETTGQQDEARIAELAGGGFVVAWRGPDGFNDGVFQQLFDVNGNAVGVNQQVNDLQNSNQGLPEITALLDGGWIVSFWDASGEDGAGQGVLAQQYDAAGNRVDSNFVIPGTTANTQTEPVLATLTDGRVVAVWTSTGTDGSSTGIFTRLLGDPETQSPSAPPQILGLPVSVELNETDVNTGYVNLAVAAVHDPDTTNFDGGTLVVGRVVAYGSADQFLPPDNADQDDMTLQSARVSIVGSDVQVDGVSVGTLTLDGQNGAALSVALDANATTEAVEELVAAIAYRNESDDPEASRTLSISFSDGDGGNSAIRLVEVKILPEVDGVVPIEGERQVNSFAENSQDASDVAALTGGGHVAVWQSNFQDDFGASGLGIFAQRFDVDGQAIGPELLVNDFILGGQTNPAVEGLSNGGFVVVWNGQGVDDTQGVFLRRFDASGNPTSGDVRLNDVVSGVESDPQVATGLDRILVVWRDSNGDGSGAGVRGAMIDNDGNEIVTDFQLNIFDAGTQTAPDVAALSGGGFIAVWESFNQSVTNTYQINARIIEDDGTLAPTEIVIRVPELNADARDAVVAGLLGGGFVVAWEEQFTDGSSTGIFAQRFDATGTAQGDAFLVNEEVQSGQTLPAIAALDTGGFVISWQSGAAEDGSAATILAQQFDAAGNRIDGNLIVNEAFQGNQTDPAIAALPNGAFVASWTSVTNGASGDGDSTGVFSRTFGDPADFNIEGRPVLEAINETVTFDENTLNAGPLLIDANNATAVSDSDSADFDGGFIEVDNLEVSGAYENQIAPPDNGAQDVLGLRQSQGITIASNVVSVDGTEVGTITSDGQAGAGFRIELNANAEAAIVELLVENLTYRNVSDDPRDTRVLRVQIGDGDGGVSDPVLVEVTINEEVDGASKLLGERQANTQTFSTQHESAIAELNTGFVIVWSSFSQETGGVSTYGIFGQRFDENGTAVGAEFQVNTTEPSTQDDPAVTGLSDGGFIVTWRDASGVDGSGSGILMQRFDDTGAAVGGETVVNTFVTSTQSEPRIVELENGDFVIVWTTINYVPGGSSNDVIAQVFNGTTNAKIGSEIFVNTEVAAGQVDPDVTALSDGGFAISWTSATSGGAGDGSLNGIFARQFGNAAAGYAPAGDEFQVNTDTQNSELDPAIAGLSGGGFVVVWTASSNQDGSADGIYGQIFDASGNPVGQEFRVNDQRFNSQNQPDVMGLDNGGFVVVFSDNNGTDGSGVGIYAQQYDENGRRVDNTIQVNTEFSGSQNDPQIAAQPGGGFVISWTSQTSGSAGDGNGSGVFYQLFNNTSPGVNDVPASTDEDSTLIFDSSVFVPGYTDPEGDPLAEIRIDSLPLSGQLLISGSPASGGDIVTFADLDAGVLTYIPNADFNGTDTFGWSGSDGGEFSSSGAEVDITVNPINDPVGLQPIANQSISEGDVLSFPLNIDDPDNDTFMVTVDYGEGSGPSQFTSSNPSLSNLYEAQGTYTVSVEVDDGAGSVENDSFEVLVANAPPDARNDSLGSVSEDATLNDNVFESNGAGVDSDPGGDPFEVTAINGAGYTTGQAFVLPSGATVTIQQNGDLTYDPTTSSTLQAKADGQNQQDTFTYTITDDEGASDSATVFVNVLGANDNVVAQDDSFTVDEDSQVTGSVFDDNGNGPDFDPEGDAIVVTEVNGSPTLVGAPVTLSGGGILTIQSDGAFSFDAQNKYDEIAAGDAREVTFSYVVEEAGSNLSASATGTVTITGVNDEPIAQNDSVNTGFDTPTAPIAVLNNDFDPDTGDTLTVTSASDGSNGTVTVNADNSLVYSPDIGFFGQDTFTYNISDGNGGSATATVTVNVDAALNTPPVAEDDTVTTNEDTEINVAVLDNDADIDGDTLTIVDFSNGGFGAVQQVGDTFTYTPNVNANGEDTFTYTVSDGQGGQDIATVTVDVVPVNDAPVALNDSGSGYSTDEDSLVTTGSVLNNDSDVEGDALTVTNVTPVSANGALVSIGATAGTFVYDPNGQFESLPQGVSTNDTFIYTVSDGNGGFDTATVTMLITGVNDAPVGSDDSYTVDEDAVLSVPAAGVLGNDTDVDGDALTAVLVDDVSNGTLTLNTDGSLSYTADANYFGADSFTYRANDGTTDGNLVTVSIEVTPVNDAPVLTNTGPYVVTENSLSVGTVAAQDDDGDALSFFIQGGADADHFDIDASTGALSFKSAPDFEAPGDADVDNIYVVDVGVSDGLEQDIETVSVSVLDVTDELSLLPGTNKTEKITGTDEAERINSFGGRLDILTGNGGADVFDFTFIVDNGVTEQRIVTDFNFEEGDRIDIGDAEIASYKVTGKNLQIYLESELDILFLREVDEFSSDYFLS